MINDIIPQIAGLAESIVDVCNSDTTNKSEVIEVLAQKIGYLSEMVLTELQTAGYKVNPSDWFDK